MTGKRRWKMPISYEETQKCKKLTDFFSEESQEEE